MKIKISVAAYNEIATALERLGVKADGTTELTLEKGTQLSCPIDFKMVTIRRDVATIAATCYKDELTIHGLEFVDFSDKLMNWIMNEETKLERKDEVPQTLTYQKPRQGWT